MNDDVRRMLLDEAARIGDELLSRAERDEAGLSWQTVSHYVEPDLIRKKSEDIYSGVSGIALFFLELYKQTRNARHLDAALEGMRWVEHFCRANPTDFFAFLPGRLGVSYTMVRMHEATGDSRYLEQALEIAEPAIAQSERPRPPDDFLNGTAGTILGLLHLHAATGERRLLEAVNALAGRLMARAECASSGLYWDRSPLNMRGLCGLSHGAAGVGFVLLELGYYLRNEAFYRLAEQAFAYEDAFYDESRKNWPDFRTNLYLESEHANYEAAYLSGDAALFTEGGDLNAWCHGAAGIGLARLRAFRLTGERSHLAAVDAAVEKSCAADCGPESAEPSFTLCRGRGGHAELFLEAYRAFGDEKYLALAEATALRALEARGRLQTYISGYGDLGVWDDNSLFMGNAGVGYFLLRLLDPRTPSVLLPTLASPLDRGADISAFTSLTLPPAQVGRIIVGKNFPRTLYVAGQLFPERIEPFFSERGADGGARVREQFIEFVRELSPALPAREGEYASDVFSMELEKVRMDEAVESHCLLHVEGIVRGREAAAHAGADDEALAARTLRLDPRVRLKLTKWDWSLNAPAKWRENLSLEPAAHAVLLRPLAKGVGEDRLSTFGFTILSRFSEAKRVSDVVDEVTDSFQPPTDERRKAVRARVLEQIRIATAARVLVG